MHAKTSSTFIQQTHTSACLSCARHTEGPGKAKMNETQPQPSWGTQPKDSHHGASPTRKDDLTLLLSTGPFHTAPHLASSRAEDVEPEDLWLSPGSMATYWLWDPGVLPEFPSVKWDPKPRLFCKAV